MPQPPDSRPVVLVTGSAQRIGREIALELAAHGWQVAVHYRRSAAEAEQTVAALSQAGGRALAFAADLADEAACESLLPAVQAAFGRVDAVVNNASASRGVANAAASRAVWVPWVGSPPPPRCSLAYRCGAECCI